ncbi:MAG: hypothetical protein HY096_07865 [Nitrospinae bacterium]|nr:hypothetical protein [Nitrospinota bacterium]
MLLSNNYNPFFIAPYKLLRIGQVCASLTLDNDFVLKTHLTEKLGLEKREEEKNVAYEQTNNAINFKILSSIGTEYIVEYPCDSSEATNNKKKNINIFRIPKDKILLVKY